MGFISKLNDENAREVIDTATRAVREAAMAVGHAGCGEAARAMIARDVSPPDDPVGAVVWPRILAEGLEALAA